MLLMICRMADQEEQIVEATDRWGLTRGQIGWVAGALLLLVLAHEADY